MGVLAEYDPPQARDRQWSSPGECKLANMAETAKQAQNNQSRDTQLVSYLLYPCISSDLALPWWR